MGMGCCNNRRGGFFEGYEAFWIIVVIAIVIIWVHYLCAGNDGCCNGSYGNDFGNNCCNSCC